MYRENLGWRFDGRRLRTTVVAAMVTVLLIGGTGTALAQEDDEDSTAPGGQSLASAANDSTASMWTFQLAWEHRSWRDDTLENGQTRPEGNRDMWQLRIVAPVPLGKNLKLLNRLTLRNNEAADRSSGAGDAEYFALFIPVEWATGRWGIGPQVNIPATSSKFGSTSWRYGFASAGLQRLADDKILTGILLQQVWGETTINGKDDLVAQPITIQPVFNYSLKNGYYLNIGDTAFSYDWQNKSWLIPVGLRFGKVFITDSGAAWNLYGEYRTTVVYKDWAGSALKDAFRINLSYAFPM